MDIASSRQDPSLHWHRFTLISTEMNAGSHTDLTQSEINSGIQIMHFSLCQMSEPHAVHKNSLPVKTVSILGLFLCIHECSGSFAWMWKVSVHHWENRILTLYQRWNNVIVNEWGFCFHPPKGTSSCFLFWTKRSIHLLAFPALDADFLSWHQCSTCYLMKFSENIFSLPSKPKIKQSENEEKHNKWKQRATEG